MATTRVDRFGTALPLSVGQVRIQEGSPDIGRSRPRIPPSNLRRRFPAYPVNWLAHLYLARQTPLDRLGQLSGDFVRGPVDARLHPQIQRGVREHRALDTWIDDHPEALELRRRMPQGLRRFAGIATDLIVDHVLARDWETYEATRSLETFAQQVANDVQTHLELCPERLADKGRRLDIGNLLVSYRLVDGLDLALERIGRRLRRPVDLHPITTWFEANDQSVSTVARAMIRDARCFLDQRRRVEDLDGSLLVASRDRAASYDRPDDRPDDASDSTAI